MALRLVATWIIASALGTAALLGCVSPAAHADGTVARHRADSLPPLKITIDGDVYAASATWSASLAISLENGHASGSITYGGRPAFTFRNVQLERLSVQRTQPLTHASYRMRFRIDACEHATALPRGAKMTTWDPCYHVEGQEKSALWKDGELYINRTMLRDREILVAAGVCDLNELTVCRFAGSKKR